MKIIPWPLKVMLSDGMFTVNKNTGIDSPDERLIDNLNGYFELLSGYRLQKGKGIKLQLVEDNKFVEDNNLGEEGYLMSVSEGGVFITSTDIKGLFYGVQTLKQILTDYFDGEKSVIPAVEIIDKPRFSYRGFMLDCCRHFFSVDFIKKLLDLCALQKLNKFHWHITEDQGWRIQIDKYPLLTEIGGKRKETRGDGVPVEGFFTKEDIKDVVKYAADRFIEVIPEFDMPGHSMAAIASYPFLSCKQQPIEVETRFGIKSVIMCAGKPTTYAFINDIISEMAEMFPSKYIHIGGDEAVKYEWRECPDCQRIIKENNLSNEEELQAFFTEKIVNILKTHNKTPIVWNESVNSGKLNPDCTVQYWSDGKRAERVVNEINNGRQVIVSKFSPYYLDYPNGMHPLRKIYRFNPILKGVEANKRDNIIGVEAPLWTEHVYTEKRAGELIFPRLCALAETAWCAADNRNLSKFKNRLPNFIKSVKLYGVSYSTVKESDVGLLVGLVQIIKFFYASLDKGAIRSSLKARKETVNAAKHGKTNKTKEK